MSPERRDARAEAAPFTEPVRARSAARWAVIGECAPHSWRGRRITTPEHGARRSLSRTGNEAPILRDVARTRFMLIPGWPAPPPEVEERIVGHLGRWVEPKVVHQGLEIARMTTGRSWGRPLDHWLVKRLDDVQPDWRDHYTYQRARIGTDDERWLSETIIATAHARVALADWKTSPDERVEAERLIAEAKEEARRRGHLPALSRTFAHDPEIHARCEIDENGRLFLPERWHGFKERDHNPT
jgi:hypothetical protein